MSANGVFYGLFLAFSAVFYQRVLTEKPDDGCGQSVLGPESGVLSSKDYPGPYPNNSRCERTIRVSNSLRIVLSFEDLFTEGEDCETDYLKVEKEVHGKKYVYWQYCGNTQRRPVLHPGSSHTLYTDSSELTVSFSSSLRSSGKGFRMSYSTVDQKDLLSCSDKGGPFSLSKHSRKFCPARCGAAEGDVAGDVSQGYDDTSHLCKSAVHAGVILDRFGGPVTLEKHSGLGQCKAVRANGILSNCSSGPLSESFFTFVTSDCNSQTILQPHVTSSWEKNAFEGSPADQPSKDSSTISPTADPSATHWLQLELGERKRITGILTKGSNSSDSYVRSYKVLYQDRKGRWRTYTLNNGSDDTVIERNVDSLYQSRNTFRPAITARTLRIVPLRWHQWISLTVELLGCPCVKATAVVSTSSQVTLEVVPTGPNAPVEKEGGTETVPLQTDPVKLVIIVVSTVLSVGLLLLGICLCKVLHKKKTKNNSYDSPDQPHTGCWKQIKSPSARQQSTEFTFSYNSEKDPLPKMDLVISDMADYQQPLMLGVGTVSRKGSTFRPMDTDPKDEVNAMHYDYLHTTNQYALPLTNQEPEYATPIIERHAFRTDGFLPDPSYSVPGVVLSKSPSFKTKDNSNYRRVGDGVTVGYQTPQVKADRVNHSEGVYDSPKIRQPSVVQNGVSAEYQRPQVKTRAPEIYSTPRDRVRLDSAAPCRPDPGGSSLSGT